MHIKIITTGGTIDKIYFDAQSEFAIGEPQVGEVLHEANVTVSYDILPLMRKDSLELTDDDRQLIYETAADDPAQHIIITHGTDTMAVTARKLLSIPDKVMVLTGAMQPARFRTTDAVFNIATAITAVQLLAPGAYIAMNGRIFDPRTVRKNRDERRFEQVPNLDE